jgi:hypothetical protein
MDFGLSALAPTILGGLGVVSAAKALMPKAPAIQPPAVMPTADSEAVQAARRRQAAELQSRSGRASTILSTDDKLGG